MSIIKLCIYAASLLLPIIGISQNITDCRKIVDLTVKSINSKSSNDLQNYLSDDFKIVDREGIVARTILKQLIAQLDDKIISYEESKQVNDEEGLVLFYDFIYEKKGSQETKFTFSAENKLKAVELFKMSVKTMNLEDTQVIKNTANQIDIPFRRMGNLIVVDVQVDGVNRNFLLDTGSPKVILNAQYFQSDPDTNQTKIISSIKGVNGSTSGLDLFHVDKLDFQGIRMDNQEILTLDLSNLEEHGNMEIYGLIGYELLKEYDLVFDYKNQILTLLNPAYFDEYELSNLNKTNPTIIKLNIETHIPVLSAIISGTEHSFGLDSGAEVNLIDDHLYFNLIDQLSNIGVDTLSGAGKGYKIVKEAQLNSMKIGGRDLNDMNTVFSDITHINNSYKLKIDGILGYELFSQQLTVLSYNRKELRLY